MELDEWLFKNKMTASDFAKSLECNRNWMYSVVNKRVKPGKRLARDIVLATQGQVTEKELMNVGNERVA